MSGSAASFVSDAAADPTTSVKLVNEVVKPMCKSMFGGHSVKSKMKCAQKNIDSALKEMDCEDDKNRLEYIPEEKFLDFKDDLQTVQNNLTELNGKKKFPHNLTPSARRDAQAALIGSVELKRRATATSRDARVEQGIRTRVNILEDKEREKVRKQKENEEYERLCEAEEKRLEELAAEGKRQAMRKENKLPSATKGESKESLKFSKNDQSVQRNVTRPSDATSGRSRGRRTQGNQSRPSNRLDSV